MNYEYDIAISFAGEDRGVADQITNLLKRQGIKVFYDIHEQASLWGEDLYVHLHEVYSSKARYCVMLLSEHYAKKAWTNHERQSAQERAFKEQAAYILPVRLDNTTIPGIRETVGYISLQNTSVEELVSLIIKKLGRNSEASVSTPLTPKFALPTTKKEFTDRDKDNFLKETFKAVGNYFQQGISEINKVAGLEGEYSQINAAKFLCQIYQNGKRKSECTVWYGGRSFGSTSISYVSKADPDAGSMTNEILYIEVNGGELGFNPVMRMDGRRGEILDAPTTAEYLWSKLMEPLNR